MTRLALLAGLSVAFFVSACGSDEAVITAKAQLKDASGVDVGKVIFTQLQGSPVTIKVQITTTSTVVMPGEHGMHIHAGKTCVAPSFMSAAGHWNPGMMNHGHPATSPHHGGDLGNVTVGADRSGTMELTSAEMTLLPGEPAKYINGLTVIFHANKDDGITQNPPGNSGARLACGVIGP